MTDKNWTVYTTEDFAPWAAFVHGHVAIDDKSEAFADMMVELLEEQGFDKLDARDAVEGATFGHYWIRQGEEHAEDFDEEFPWFWCKEDTKGAVAITGLKFQ